jgi:DNA-binding MarR family transcriptional regulator
VKEAGVPESTGLRWLANLIDRDLCEKIPDRTDARRQFVSLTPLGRSAMNNYFSATGELAGALDFARAA